MRERANPRQRMSEPTAESPPSPAHSRRPRSHNVRTLAVILALWVWVTLGYTYSSGERGGYVQKLSKKGWLCKTWEGELAMANLPGTMPEIFRFSVRSDSVASLIEQNVGK